MGGVDCTWCIQICTRCNTYGPFPTHVDVYPNWKCFNASHNSDRGKERKRDQWERSAIRSAHHSPRWTIYVAQMRSDPSHGLWSACITPTWRVDYHRRRTEVRCIISGVLPLRGQPTIMCFSSKRWRTMRNDIKQLQEKGVVPNENKAGASRKTRKICHGRWVAWDL